MSIEELRAFLAVAEHMSFVGAANALGLPRTTLRRQVDALEARCGVPLVERGHAGVVLTEAGRLLAERGPGIDREFSALLRSVRELGSSPAGLIRLLLPVGLPHRSIADIAAMTRAAWPGIRTHLRFSDAPLAATLADVDLLVWFGLDTPVGAWRCHTLVHTPLKLIATTHYLAEHGTPRTLEDLDRHALYVWTGRGGEAAITTKQGVRHPVTATMTSTNVDLLYECVYRELGLAWVPDGNIPDPPGVAPHVSVMEDVVGAPYELRIAVPVALASTPRIDAFLSNLEAVRSAAYEPLDEPAE
ncbi:MAG TPA: LysR family transcriptional regulator [Kofleriaceae bacterium]|nr:LysR family transcriptional regulator [Kofleriaceae bacterium]